MDFLSSFSGTHTYLFGCSRTSCPAGPLVVSPAPEPLFAVCVSGLDWLDRSVFRRKGCSPVGHWSWLRLLFFHARRVRKGSIPACPLFLAQRHSSKRRRSRCVHRGNYSSFLIRCISTTYRLNAWLDIFVFCFLFFCFLLLQLTFPMITVKLGFG